MSDPDTFSRVASTPTELQSALAELDGYSICSMTSTDTSALNWRCAVRCKDEASQTCTDDGSGGEECQTNVLGKGQMSCSAFDPTYAAVPVTSAFDPRGFERGEGSILNKHDSNGHCKKMAGVGDTSSAAVSEAYRRYYVDGTGDGFPIFRNQKITDDIMPSCLKNTLVIAIKCPPWTEVLPQVLAVLPAIQTIATVILVFLFFGVSSGSDSAGSLDAKDAGKQACSAAFGEIFENPLDSIVNADADAASTSDADSRAAKRV
jgi:hypothetical protein